MAKGKKVAEISVLYRTEKWEIKLSPEQEKLLVRVSDSLGEVYNKAFLSWMYTYGLYREEKKSCPGQKPTTKLPSLFDHINQLTELGEQDRRANYFRGKVPRNWKEETLDFLHGSLSSFFTLVKNGDRDARPPRARSETHFGAIPGRSGFAVRDKRIVLAPTIFGRDTLSFPIPDHQWNRLSQALRLKKFIISRDEAELRKPGTYWISVSYEIPKPEQIPFLPNEAVYVSLGASWIGILSPKGAEVVELPRPDRHWKPIVDSISERLQSKTRKKYSRSWKRLSAARRVAFEKMGSQQKLRIRSLVQHVLLKHGTHFVLTDLIVRSKEGKLADSSKAERGGRLGLNWAAQNSGSISYLASWLEEKALEYGGTVQRLKLVGPLPSGQGRENKVPMAEALREQFMAQTPA